MGDDAFYVQSGDSDAIGPLTTELIVEGVRHGRVPVSARICPVGASEWAPLAAHPLFAAVVREAAPPPPPRMDALPASPYPATAAVYAGGVPPTGQDPVYFQDNAAFVSRSRVVLNGVTYPVNGITSVRAIAITKNWTGFVLGLAGCFVSLLIVLASFQSPAFGMPFFVLGGVCSGAALWVTVNYLMQRDRYVLLIGAAGAERHALVSDNHAYIYALLQGINNALASRS